MRNNTELMKLKDNISEKDLYETLSTYQLATNQVCQYKFFIIIIIIVIILILRVNLYKDYLRYDKRE